MWFEHFHPDELRDNHGRWSKGGLLAAGVEMKATGRARGHPAQAVMYNRQRIGHVESHGNGQFSAFVGKNSRLGVIEAESHGHGSIADAAAHIAAHHISANGLQNEVRARQGGKPADRIAAAAQRDTLVENERLPEAVKRGGNPQRVALEHLMAARGLLASGNVDEAKTRVIAARRVLPARSKGRGHVWNAMEAKTARGMLPHIKAAMDALEPGRNHMKDTPEEAAIRVGKPGTSKLHPKARLRDKAANYEIAKDEWGGAWNGKYTINHGYYGRRAATGLPSWTTGNSMSASDAQRLSKLRNEVSHLVLTYHAQTGEGPHPLGQMLFGDKPGDTHMRLTIKPLADGSFKVTPYDNESNYAAIVRPDEVPHWEKVDKAAERVIAQRAEDRMAKEETRAPVDLEPLSHALEHALKVARGQSHHSDMMGYLDTARIMAKDLPYKHPGRSAALRYIDRAQASLSDAARAGAEGRMEAHGRHMSAARNHIDGAIAYARAGLPNGGRSAVMQRAKEKNERIAADREKRAEAAARRVVRASKIKRSVRGTAEEVAAADKMRKDPAFWHDVTGLVPTKPGSRHTAAYIVQRKGKATREQILQHSSGSYHHSFGQRGLNTTKLSEADIAHLKQFGLAGDKAKPFTPKRSAADRVRATHVDVAINREEAGRIASALRSQAAPFGEAVHHDHGMWAALSDKHIEGSMGFPRAQIERAVTALSDFASIHGFENPEGRLHDKLSSALYAADKKAAKAAKAANATKANPANAAEAIAKDEGRDNAVRRELDRIEAEVAAGHHDAALEAIASGRLEAAAKADQRERRAAGRADVRERVDEHGFMPLADHPQKGRMLAKLQRGNVVYIKGHKGAQLVFKRHGGKVYHRAASEGPLQRREIIGRQKQSSVRDVTHVKMSKGVVGDRPNP